MYNIMGDTFFSISKMLLTISFMRMLLTKSLCLYYFINAYLLGPR
jgi:hypothetical protein